MLLFFPIHFFITPLLHFRQLAKSIIYVFHCLFFHLRFQLRILFSH